MTGVKREATFATALALLASAIYLAPFAHHLDWTGIEDWTTWEFYEVVSRRVVSEFRQFPLWNPYACGGEPYHAHPFTRVLAPLTPLHWLWNRPNVSLRFEAFLLVAGSALLSYWLARRQKRSPAGAAMAAIVVAFAGTVSSRLYAGHLGLLQIPWVLLALLTQNVWPTAGGMITAALALTLAIFSGGNYLATCACVMLAFEATWEAVQRRQLSSVYWLLGTLALMLAFSAVKTLPTLDFLREVPRFTSGQDPFAAGGPLLSFLRPLGKNIPGAEFNWHEYAAYLGWLPLSLAALALLWAPQRAARPLLHALLLIWIASGQGLWPLLHQLPLFDSMRIPARFLLVAMIPMGQLAGLGIDELARRNSWSRWFFIGICFFDLTLVARPVLSRAWVPPTPAFFLRNVPHDSAFHQVRGSPSVMADAARHNLGTVRCAEGMPIRRSQRLRTPTQPGYRGEAWIMGEGSAQITRYTANEIDVDVDIRSARGATLIINQNWQNGGKGWTCNMHEQPRDFEGLGAVPLPPGRSQVRLAYRSPATALGLGISLGSALLTVLGLLCAKLYRFGRSSRFSIPG